MHTERRKLDGEDVHGGGICYSWWKWKMMWWMRRPAGWEVYTVSALSGGRGVKKMKQMKIKLNKRAPWATEGKPWFLKEEAMSHILNQTAHLENSHGRDDETERDNNLTRDWVEGAEVHHRTHFIGMVWEQLHPCARHSLGLTPATIRRATLVTTPTPSSPSRDLNSPERSGK